MKYISIFKNWRILALTAVLTASAMLLLGDSDDIGWLVAAKVSGLAMMRITTWLYGRWKGMMGELDVFNIE